MLEMKKMVLNASVLEASPHSWWPEAVPLAEAEAQ